MMVTTNNIQLTYINVNLTASEKLRKVNPTTGDVLNVAPKTAPGPSQILRSR